MHRDDVSWLEFCDKLIGLLSADTRLSRHFAPDEAPTPELEDGDDG